MSSLVLPPVPSPFPASTGGGGVGKATTPWPSVQTHRLRSRLRSLARSLPSSSAASMSMMRSYRVSSSRSSSPSSDSGTLSRSPFTFLSVRIKLCVLDADGVIPSEITRERSRSALCAEVRRALIEVKLMVEIRRCGSLSESVELIERVRLWEFSQTTVGR